MGSKLIQISPQEGHAEAVIEGDVIYSQTPVKTDEMLKSLDVTSNYIEKISLNLYEITSKLNNSESLWALLSDTTVTRDLKNAIAEFKEAGSNSSELTQAGKNLVQVFEQGNGLAHMIFTDTTLSQQLATSLEQILQASNHASWMMEDVNKIVDNIGQGDGLAGLLLMDTLFREAILNSALNIEQGTDGFNQNMEALKGNFLFRRYFRRLEKQKKQGRQPSDGETEKLPSSPASTQ